MEKKNNNKKKIEDKREIRIGELRAIPSEDDAMIVEGYAAVFESPATHYGFTEIIARGAFDGCDMKDVPFRYNHKDGFLILARTKNKSLKLETDYKGLLIRVELIDTQSNRDVYKSIQEELLDKMSFSFTCGKDEWDYDNNTRRVISIDRLYDVSVVDTPFYDGTDIYARALNALDDHKAELERENRAKLELEKARNKNKMRGSS